MSGDLISTPSGLITTLIG